jgi:thioredoxin reductase
MTVILRRLSDDLILCTNGTPEIEDEQLGQLQGAGVGLHRQPVAEIVAAGDGVELRFKDGAALARDLVFVHHTPRDHQPVERLSLDRTEDGRIQVDETGQTSIPGLYAAGDLATHAQVALAVATGAVAGSAASIVMAYEDLAQAA